MRQKNVWKEIFFLVVVMLNNSTIFPIEDLNKIYSNAIKLWNNGQIQDSIGALEYIVYNSTDDKLILKAGKDLVVLLNDTGENSLALGYIEKLKAIQKNDPYLQLEKVWALFSLNKYKEAADNIDEIFTFTADEDIIYFSRFLKSLILSKLSGYEKAIDELQTVYKKYPPLLASSAYTASEFYARMKKRLYAINMIKDSLVYDPQNIQALIDLAHIYEDSGYFLPSLQSFYTLKEIDYTNPYFSNKTRKLAKKINKKPDNLFFYSRIAWPVHDKPLTDRNSDTPLKISLYSDINQNPSYLSSFYFITNVDFEIYDSVLGKTYSGKKNMQYNMEYIKSNRIFELKDNSKSKVYSTRNNFEIRLKEKNGVILIKNPEINEEFVGVNKGDIEISGNLEILVSTSGMKLYNKSYLEHILPSVVSLINIPKDNKDNYELIKALTVIVRTYFIKQLENKDYIYYDLLPDYKFKGLQYEKQIFVDAARDTQKEVLIDKYGKLYNVSYSINSGGKTKKGVDDNSTKPDILTPFNLYRWIYFDFTKKMVYSIPQNQEDISRAWWIIVLKPKWIEDRVNRYYKLGNIKNIYVLKRDEFGIVKSIKIEGSASNVIIEGEDEVNRFLAGGSLRSNLFYLRQINKGKFPEFFILRGIGTGKFDGLCIDGSYYLSKNIGYTYTSLLKHYFPDGSLKKWK